MLDTGETLVLNERMMERVEELGGAPLSGSGDPPRSGVYVPLFVGGKAIGRITLQNMERENAYSESDVRLLTTIAGSLSVALENARLFEETRQRSAELALINDVQGGLAERMNTRSMYELVGDRIQDIFDAQVESVHEDRGTMRCRLTGITAGTPVELETPLVRAELGSPLRVGIRAGDILLATAPPAGLSARNVLAGRIATLERRDVIVSARVDCGVEMEVHLTLAARDSLALTPDKDVWLVIKTHSCHLMRN